MSSASYFSLHFSYVTKRRKVDIKFIIRGVLGSLVSVTGKLYLYELTNNSISHFQYLDTSKWKPNKFVLGWALFQNGMIFWNEALFGMRSLWDELVFGTEAFSGWVSFWDKFSFGMIFFSVLGSPWDELGSEWTPFLDKRLSGWGSLYDELDLEMHFFWD